jgi:glycosyltransferase involved in cell wall biosynthesis
MGRFHFWAADTAGSSYYRAQMPGMSLQWLGHQVTGGMRLPHDWRDLDTLVGCRVAKPEPTQMWQHFRQETNTRLVLDLDDDYFHIDPTNQHAAQTWDKAMLQRLADNMALADLVTCCSEPLARVLRDYAADVRVIPNGLPAQLLGKPRDYKADGRPLSVGWAGTSSTVAELPDAVRALNRIAAYPRPGGVQVRIVGITAEHAMGLGLKGRGVGALGWVPSVDNYLQAVSEWDVWVAPYRDTAFNRCLDAATLITTDHGVIPIGDIKTGMRVWRDGWKAVEEVWTETPVVGREIVTTRGLRLALTNEHRLMTADGEWTKAADLSVGKRLKLTPEECPDLPYLEVPWPADGRITADGEIDPLAFAQATDGPKIRLNELWGRFLGLFTGDGGFNTTTALSIACDGQDQDLIESIVSDMQAVGFRAQVRTVKTWGGNATGGKTVHVSSAHLTRFLGSVGAAEPHATRRRHWQRTYRVPPVVFRSPLSVRAAFLAGLFEADGAVSGSSVTMTSKSKLLAEDVQRLLWSIGVPSSISRRSGTGNYRNRWYWTVRLRRKESDLFAAKVGFLSARKRGRLSELVGTTPSNAARPIEWHDEIVSVKDRFVTPVDIQVEGSEYSAIGIVSHNSKFATKWLESSVLGIPLIASDIEPYRTVIRHGENGFLVRREHEWGRYLKLLADDPELRQRVGMAARGEASGSIMQALHVQWQAALTAPVEVAV